MFNTKSASGCNLLLVLMALVDMTGVPERFISERKELFSVALTADTAFKSSMFCQIILEYKAKRTKAGAPSSPLALFLSQTALPGGFLTVQLHGLPGSWRL